MCPRHIQRFDRVRNAAFGYVHTVDAYGNDITGYYRCALCTQQVEQENQPYFERLRTMAIVGIVLGVGGLIALTVSGFVSHTDPGGRQLVGWLEFVGCYGGPGLLIGAGLLYRWRYVRYP
jgi:hypothetical protein